MTYRILNCLVTVKESQSTEKKKKTTTPGAVWESLAEWAEEPDSVYLTGLAETADRMMMGWTLTTLLSRASRIPRASCKAWVGERKCLSCTNNIAVFDMPSANVSNLGLGAKPENTGNPDRTSYGRTFFKSKKPQPWDVYCICKQHVLQEIVILSTPSTQAEDINILFTRGVISGNRSAVGESGRWRELQWALLGKLLFALVSR